MGADNGRVYRIKSPFPSGRFPFFFMDNMKLLSKEKYRNYVRMD